MANFSEIKQGLDDIATDIRSERQRLAQGVSMVTLANNNLGALATKHASLVLAINTLATEEPDNPAVTVAKAEKDQLVAEFQSLKTEAQAKVTAITK